MSLFTPHGHHYHESPPDNESLPTYKEIARSWGVCYQRVQQIEQRAIQKLREAIEKEAEAAGVSPVEWFRGG